jgi:hypothetical protein
MARRYCFLALGCLALFAHPIHSQLPTPEEFKTKAIEEWTSLVERIHSMRSERTREHYTAGDQKPLWIYRREVAQGDFSPTGFLYRVDEERFDERGKVTERANDFTLANTQYRAELARPKRGEGWLVGDVKQGPQYLQSLKGEGSLPTAVPWLIIGNVPLWKWLKDPSFVITGIEALPAEGKVVRVRFRHAEAERKSPELVNAKPIQDGYLDFDTSRSHRPLRYEYRGRSSFGDYVRTGALEYAGGDGIPVLTAVREEGRGRHERKLTDTLKIEYNVDVPEEEFRLSHYGLPEPVGVKWKRPMPVAVWFGLGAFVCLVLAVGCKRAARHFREKKAAGAPAKA